MLLVLGIFTWKDLLLLFTITDSKQSTGFYSKTCLTHNKLMNFGPDIKGGKKQNYKRYVRGQLWAGY